MHRRQFLGACAGVAIMAPQPPTRQWRRDLAADPLSAEVAPPFPLSIMLWTVRPDLPFARRLEMVAEAGYHACELVGEFKDWNDQEYAAVRKQSEALGITFDASSGINSSLCDPAQRPALLKEIQAHLVRLEKLQCTKLILLSGDRVEGLSHAQMHTSCVEAVKAAADLAAENHVELLLENIDPEENPRYFLTSVAEGFAVVREAGRPNVKFLYDFFHDQITEGNLIEKLEKNIDLVGLVHIADVPGRHEPGTGEINYANIFRKLRSLKYQRYAAMEFVPTGDTVAALVAARTLATSS